MAITVSDTVYLFVFSGIIRLFNYLAISRAKRDWKNLNLIGNNSPPLGAEDGGGSERAEEFFHAGPIQENALTARFNFRLNQATLSRRSK